MLLEIKELNVGYGDIQVLWDVNLQIEEGQIVALVGANGAGKSTLLKTVSGLLTPYSGNIIFQGEDIARNAFQRNRRQRNYSGSGREKTVSPNDSGRKPDDGSIQKEKI